MKIKYNTSVYTDCGWRGAEVIAEAEAISSKRVRIVAVDDINGDGNTGWASVTGAQRQRYSCGGAAAREVGKIKNLSACVLIG